MYKGLATLVAICATIKAISAADDDVLYTYRTVAVTECFANTGLVPIFNGGGPTPTINKPGVIGETITVELEAPSCDCGCSTCAHTISYATTYDALCDSGLCKQAYEVTEIYRGMAAKPTPPPNDIPYGFTREVQTCTSCGQEPITATITCPVTTCPYINGISEPSPAPYGAKPYNENRIESGKHVEDEPSFGDEGKGTKKNGHVDYDNADTKNYEHVDYDDADKHTDKYTDQDSHQVVGEGADDSFSVDEASKSEESLGSAGSDGHGEASSDAKSESSSSGGKPPSGFTEGDENNTGSSNELGDGLDLESGDTEGPVKTSGEGSGSPSGDIEGPGKSSGEGSKSSSGKLNLRYLRHVTMLTQPQELKQETNQSFLLPALVAGLQQESLQAVPFSLFTYLQLSGSCHNIVVSLSLLELYSCRGRGFFSIKPVLKRYESMSNNHAVMGISLIQAIPSGQGICFFPSLLRSVAAASNTEVRQECRRF